MSSNDELKRKIKEEYQKCATDRAYFIRRHVKIQHPIKGTIPFNMHDYQEKCLNSFVDNQNNIVLKGRQIGLSTLVSAYALHEMIFKAGSNVVVIATKLATAKNLISKIRFAYKKLPIYLQEPCIEDNKLSLVFRNGSRIVATTSAGDSARSEAASILIIDECLSEKHTIYIRNKETGEVRHVTVKTLYEDEEIK